MNDFEARETAGMRPWMMEAGAALWDCQIFEFLVALLLYHLAKRGFVGLAPATLNRILENKDKKTAGQLVNMLKEHVTVNKDIEVALAEGLEARNLLIHRVLVENALLFDTQAGRDVMTGKIRALREQVKKADLMLRPSLFALDASLDGETPEEFKQRVLDMLRG